MPWSSSGDGDLAYKKIFSSFHAIVKHGHLDRPVIRGANAGRNLPQLRTGPATL
jgi:hypothetical protein